VVTALGTLVAVPAVAQTGTTTDNTAYGTTSAEFLSLGAGARAAALGGSFAALANDVTALYWNPAGVALMDRPGVSVSTYTYVANTRYNWAGLAFPMSGGERAIGIQAGTFGFSGQPVYTLANPEGDGSTYSVSEFFGGLTYAQNFSDRFSAGITAKMISDNLALTSATAFAVDFGTNFHAQIGARSIRASFVISNLGSTLRHTGTGLDVAVIRQPPLDQQNIPQEAAPADLKTKDWSLPVMFRVGVALDLMQSASSRVTLLSEFNQPNNSKPGFNGGLEWALTNIGNSGFTAMARGSYSYQSDNSLTITNAAGFNTTLTSQRNQDGLAFGGGLDYDRGQFGIGIDYAYRSLGVLGGTNFFSATLHW
jgi:hypothetical protein